NPIFVWACTPEVYALAANPISNRIITFLIISVSSLVLYYIVRVAQAEFIKDEIGIVVPGICIDHDELARFIKNNRKVILLRDLLRGIPDFIHDRLDQFILLQEEKAVEPEYLILILFQFVFLLSDSCHALVSHFLCQKDALSFQFSVHRINAFRHFLDFLLPTLRKQVDLALRLPVFGHFV